MRKRKVDTSRVKVKQQPVPDELKVLVVRVVRGKKSLVFGILVKKKSSL